MTFNLVVTCVKSKKCENPKIGGIFEDLLRNGIRNDTEKLFEEWKSRLTQHMKRENVHKSSDLYKGAQWKASKKAFEQIRRPRELWIISCGFGFINSEEKISGYCATFGRGEDSIYNRKYFRLQNDVKKRWWALLIERGILVTNHPKSIHELVNESKQDDVVLVVAGKDYYEAIYDDLDKIGDRKNLPKLAFISTYPKVTIPNHLKVFLHLFNSKESQKQLKQKFDCCNKNQVLPNLARCVIEAYYKTGKLECGFLKRVQ